MDASQCDQLDFIVHNFVHGSPTSEAFVREQGRDILVQASGSGGGWRSCQPKRPQLGKARRGFVYALQPPQIASTTTRMVALKEWNTPPSADELFRLSDLSEFSSSDFTHTVSKRLPPRTISPPPAKKRKIAVNHSFSSSNSNSLRHLIPQPHFHPSPPHVSKRQPTIPSYKKSKPTFLPPYTATTIAMDLPEWNRCAWVVPLRGILPWAGSTSAVVLTPSSSSQVPSPVPPEPGANQVVTWSHQSIAQFWTFLLSLREAGALGPLGLSFHPSSAPSFPTPHYTINNKSTNSIGGGGNVSTAQPGSPLSLASVDYIKIYHDWPRTLHIRNILHSWSFENREGGSSSSNKIRVLLGARLVLLDDKSRGIMIL